MVAELDPALVVLGNLFRDQLDRYGELERLADDWAAMAAERAGRTGFVLNADDPLVADLGRDRERRRDGVSYFGIETRRRRLSCNTHDAKHCRRCGAPYAYERASWATSATTTVRTARPTARCRTSPRPQRTPRHERLEVARADPGRRGRPRVPLPGLYNVYNALAARDGAPPRRRA